MSRPELAPEVQRLPLVTLCLTERCNSRCVGCDYWRTGRLQVDSGALAELLPALSAWQTRVVLISGGEPLTHPQWANVAEQLRGAGLKLWLLTAGLALAKHAREVARLFDAVTVSLDGATPEVYRSIRGVDAFRHVCAGVQAASAAGVPVGLRVTIQRENYRQLADFVPLARRLGARQLSFLAVDVSSAHAFGRQRAVPPPPLALEPHDLPILARCLDEIEQKHAEDFRSGFIAESPRKLRRLYQYFAALCGCGPFPPVRCNVYEYSVVFAPGSRVSPCFFIPGPSAPATATLQERINAQPMRVLRQEIAAGRRPECARCVCSLWRSSEERQAADFLMRAREFR